MKYKLIVLDLDGTLTNSKKEITPRNRETLIRMDLESFRLLSLLRHRLIYLVDGYGHIRRALEQLH